MITKDDVAPPLCCRCGKHRYDNGVWYALVQGGVLEIVGAPSCALTGARPSRFVTLAGKP